MKSRNAPVPRYPPVLPSTSKSSSAFITERSSSTGAAAAGGAAGAGAPGSPIVSPANRSALTVVTGRLSGATSTANSTEAFVGLKHMRSLHAW